MIKNKMRDNLTFLDLFAGTGGLSEGFIRAGFIPIGHVEADQAACYTLKSRMVYHWLLENSQDDKYLEYLNGKMARSEFYSIAPEGRIQSVINQEITKETLNDIFLKVDRLLGKRRLDLITGGPPCQAYSLIGRNRTKGKILTDHRNYLYTYYAEFLKRYKPKYFVFENVMGILSAKAPDGKRFFDNMVERFEDVGYQTEFKVLSAEEYGVLQHRKRVILVGRRGKENGFYPDPEKWNPGVKVREVLRDLPSLKSGCGSIHPCQLKPYNGSYLYRAGIRNDDYSPTWHIARPHTEQDLEIYRIVVKSWREKKERLSYNDLPDVLKSHKNRASFLDRFKVVAAELPSAQTITAHISKDGHYYIHPYIKQNRSLTPREAARLQTFPDDYYFESKSEPPGRTPVYHQIGNAVPVLLAQKIAEKIMETWQ